jgi:transcriptional regulator EpsA
MCELIVTGQWRIIYNIQSAYPNGHPSEMASSDSSFNPEVTVRIMRGSLAIQSHFQLLLWLQGSFQEAVPHDVLISFSGAVGGEVYHYDIVSAIPGIRTARLPPGSIKEFRSGVYEQWKNGGEQITSASIPEGCKTNIDAADLHAELRGMKHVLFHAIPDTRFNADHLYILLRRTGDFTERERKLFELLLPHVDAAVRKIDGLPVVEPEQVAAPALLSTLIKSGLSEREIEILEWVRSGKTNIEIGMILSISTYTVKNHLQRIFRKINVSNRAQAVGKLENIMQLSPPELACA